MILGATLGRNALGATASPNALGNDEEAIHTADALGVSVVAAGGCRDAAGTSTVALTAAKC